VSEGGMVSGTILLVAGLAQTRVSVSAFLVIPIQIISMYMSLRDRRLQKAAVCASPGTFAPLTTAACGRSFRGLGYQNKSRHALEMREVVRNQWHGVAHGERCNP
jgi:hypothetical protein